MIGCPGYSATLTGSVLEKETNAPITGATLVLEPEENGISPAVEAPGNSLNPAADSGSTPSPARFSTETDLKGLFQVTVPDGLYRVTAVAPGFGKSVVSRMDLRQDFRHDFFLEPKTLILPEVVVSTERAPKVRTGHKSVSKKELVSVPGTAGDPLRVLQTLPGVVLVGDFWDALMVRGAGPLDNLFLVDRIPMAFPFHFSGLFSTLNPDMVKNVDFSAGGYGPEYGLYYGGVIDVVQRDPRRDRWGARAEVSPVFSAAGVEGPITPESSLSLSGRRSYLELFGGLFDQFTAVPWFYDYQVKLVYDPSPQTHWDLQSFGSEDRIALNLTSDFSLSLGDPTMRGIFTYSNVSHSQGLNFRHVFDGANSLMETAYHTTFSYFVDAGGDYHLILDSEEFGNRLDWVHDFDPGAQLRVGWEFKHCLMESDIFIGRVPGQDDLNPFNNTVYFLASGRFTAVSDNSSLYFEQKFKALDQRLEISAGNRLDYQSYGNHLQTGLRLSASYAPTESTTFNASYGHYYQLPYQGLYQAPDYGNPQLDSELAVAVVLGVEQKLCDGLSLRVEGYNKDLSRLVEMDYDSNYNNEGTGHTRGLEFFLRRPSRERFSGWISYSLSDSQRRDGAGMPLQRYTYDQTHALVAVANFKLTSYWELGAKWRYATGLPYTPVIGAEYYWGDYRPLFGPENSERLPDYLQLDLSTTFGVDYQTWQWKVCLEAWNATNHENVLAYSYNEDYSQRHVITQLPLIPYLSFEVKF